MRQIYNKSALEKLSSPDQLDKMIVVASRKLWLFLIAAALVLAVALAWAIFGSVPVNLDAEGVYMNTGGTEILYSQNSGLISDVSVEIGQEVKKGDILAYIRVEDEMDAAQDLSDRIHELERLDFDSQGDLPSNDNAQLLEVKRNVLTLNSGVASTKASLALKEQMRNAAEGKAAEKEYLMDERWNAYCASIQGSGQRPSIEYSQAQSAYSVAQSKASSLKNLYVQAQNTYDAALLSFNSKYVGSDGRIIGNYSDVPGTPNYNAEYAVAKAQLAAADAAVDAYESEYEAAAAQEHSSKREANATKNIYENQQDYETIRASFNTVSYAEYTKALSDYTSAEAQYQSLISETEVLAMQLKLEEDNLSVQTQMLRTQFDNTKGALLDRLNTEREKYLEKIGKSNVAATADGTVYELAIKEGGAIQQGGMVGSIIVGSTGVNTVVCYVPLQDAKKLSVGMPVRTYPSIVNRQEFGYIAGTVSKVGSYPATAAEMLADMGSDTLVSQFQRMGPAIAVHCELEKDENTASGYKWSTKKGGDVVIPPCTLMSASIETEQKAPIDIIIPYIKEKFSFDDRF